MSGVQGDHRLLNHSRFPPAYRIRFCPLNRRGGRWPRPPLVSLPRKYRRSARCRAQPLYLLTPSGRFATFGGNSPQGWRFLSAHLRVALPPSVASAHRARASLRCPKSLCRSTKRKRFERPKAARNASLRTPYRSPHHLTPPLYPRLYLHPHKKEGPFRPSLRFTCNEPRFLLPDGRSQRSRFVLRHRFLGHRREARALWALGRRPKATRRWGAKRAVGAASALRDD